MLFNSHEFLFVFLPATLLGFFLIGRFSRQGAILWLILTSLVFYGWWRPLNILIIGPSVIINYFLASFLLKLSQRGGQPGLSRAVLLAGLLFNIAFLGFFKYADFVYGTINDVFGANLILLNIILPLGISFITFQKIAFLIDVQAGRVKAFTFREYCTFVLFFPQLIAGPIVHYREMMPQFATATCRFDKESFAVGLTLLFFGLFKKGVLADNIAPLVTPIYEHSAAAGHTPFLLSWMAAVGFTLQVYFDFSGYTDMALGLARILRHQAAAELQFAAQGLKHHRLLAALAYDAHALPDRLCLQPDGVGADATARREGTSRFCRAQSSHRGVRVVADRSVDRHHVHIWALAWGRLWFHHFWPHARRLPRREFIPGASTPRIGGGTERPMPGS